MATNPVRLGEMLISHLTGKVSGNIVDALNVFSMDDPNTGDVAFHDGAFDFDIASHDGTNGLLLGGTLVKATAAQINALSTPTLTTVDQTALFDVGETHKDQTGNVFIYLEGIGSVVTGDWVTYLVLSTSGATTVRAIANAQGPLAVAMAAVIAGDFGWFQIFGYTVAAGAISGGDAAVGADLFLTSTAGLVDDVFVDGDFIWGAVCTVQEGESPSSAANIGCFLTYPYCNDVDIVS